MFGFDENVYLQPDAKKEPGHKLQLQWIFFCLPFLNINNLVFGSINFQPSK